MEEPSITAYAADSTESTEGNLTKIFGDKETLLKKLVREHKLILIISACALLIASFWSMGLLYMLSFALLADFFAVSLSLKPKQARIKAELLSRLDARGQGGKAPLIFNAALYARYTALETALLRAMILSLTAAPYMVNLLLQSILHYGTLLRMLFAALFLAVCAGAFIFCYNLNRECADLDRICAEKREQNRLLFTEFGEDPLPFLD